MNLFVVMGVSGSGKSSVARMLAEATGGTFLDADDFHTPENKSKMASGIKLNDTDRWNWLERLNLELRKHAADPYPHFLACSALRKTYREHLAMGLEELKFIYLQGSQDCIHRRMEERKGHFMPTGLLDSQFQTLEEPTSEEALIISVENPLLEIITRVLLELQGRPEVKA